MDYIMEGSFVKYQKLIFSIKELKWQRDKFNQYSAE